ncbi:MAG: YgiQ family radical SAM protein [Lentisphaerae bacterium]|nr:YgiQ family radical SAM protein [Lentisphaerota bacterium]
MSHDTDSVAAAGRGSKRNRDAFAASLLLPVDAAGMRGRGWEELDVLLVTGDAYVDHPAFGAALLGRWLERHGFRVGIVAQPRWTTAEDVARMGRPRLCVGVTAGSLDSMLAHYTAFRRKRRDDAYTPGGRSGARPNRATLVYAALARRAFPGTPVIAGGIEASMRRATHYDFWEDALRRSVLLDSKADLLVYGMAERSMLRACERLRSAAEAGEDPARAVREGLLRGIPGTAHALCPRDGRALRALDESAVVRLPSHEEIAARPARLMEATLLLERQVHAGTAAARQDSGAQVVVFSPPAPPLAAADLDALYALAFTRRAHPCYSEPVPALETVRFSVTTHRGCAGGCAFCSLALHQGRRIASRGDASVLSEVRGMTRHPDWKGSVSDVGGPSANMWGAACRADPAACARASCLVPEICPHFATAQGALADLLDAVAAVEGVKHVRVASGVRHDLAARDPDYLRRLIRRYVGGQLKVAPEHCCDRVLALMRKPPFRAFEEFLDVFERVSRAAGREQYVVPYLISAYPGTADEDMRALRGWLDRRRWRPRQVQCFIPLPGTAAAAMYYAGVAPDGAPVPVPRGDAARLRQHGILTRAGGS